MKAGRFHNINTDLEPYTDMHGNLQFFTVATAFTLVLATTVLALANQYCCNLVAVICTSHEIVFVGVDKIEITVKINVMWQVFHDSNSDSCRELRNGQAYCCVRDRSWGKVQHSKWWSNLWPYSTRPNIFVAVGLIDQQLDNGEASKVCIALYAIWNEVPAESKFNVNPLVLQ